MSKARNRPLAALDGRNGLTPKQEQAAFDLAAGKSLAEASRNSGAGERTIRTWESEQPEFLARIAALRAEMTGRALGLMADGMADAALTLRHLCNKSKNEGIRLKASEALLAHGMKLRESVELEERIAALETKPAQRRTA